MENTVIQNDTKSIPYISTCNGKVVEASDSFTDMTGYSSRDVSGKDMKETNEENMLKRQYDHMYSIIDNLDLPIIRLSYPDMNIIEINKKTCEHLYSLDECECRDAESIRGKNVYEIFPDYIDDEYAHLLSQLAETKTPVYLNNVVSTLNGEKHYEEIILQPLFNSEGDIVEILAIIMDVTSRVQRNKDLERLLKNQEEFFSFISHEFKTPITVTSTAIQAMRLICGDELSDTAKGFIQQINRSTLQQLRLVNNLLDITRSVAGYLRINKRNLDIVPLTRNIADSVFLYAKDKGVNIRFLSSGEPMITAVDDEKYERILLNLLSNAIKFTPEGKSIEVSVSKRRNKACIEVRDEGIGIPEDKQHMIFERFKQSENGLIRNTQGTGIGLCLVKMLVKAMGGKISVSSEEGKGSAFTFLLPLETISSADDRMLQCALDDRLGQTVKIEFSSLDV